MGKWQLWWERRCVQRWERRMEAKEKKMEKSEDNIHRRGKATWGVHKDY